MKKIDKHVLTLEEYIKTIDDKEVNGKYALLPGEIRVLILILDQINKDEVISLDKEYKMFVCDFATLYNLDLKPAKYALHGGINSLLTKVLVYTDYDGTKWTTHWISSLMNYDKSDNEITFYFPQGIIPLISELRKCFTSYKVKYLCKLKSTYGLRFYELALMELTKSRKVSLTIVYKVEDLYEMFDIEPEAYKEFSSFNASVLKRSFKEINEKTNLNVDILGYKRTGRAVTSVEIAIAWAGNGEIGGGRV